MNESQFNPTRSMPDSVFMDVVRKQSDERDKWAKTLAPKLEQKRKGFKLPSQAPKPKSFFERLFG